MQKSQSMFTINIHNVEENNRQEEEVTENPNSKN